MSGNRPQAALASARAEGVIDRVELCHADVRALPFGAGAFDVVVSNFVVHEMDTKADRETMLCEIVRVMRPGGRIALADFVFTRQCVEVLHAHAWGTWTGPRSAAGRC